MKKIIILILVSTSFLLGVKAQTQFPNTLPITKANGWVEYGYIRADSGFCFVARDTFKARYATLILHNNGNFYKTAGNGGAWSLFTGSGGTSITLTTTGTSGAATYNSGTGALNIPVYSSGGGTGWGLTGNASTVAGTNFIGTTDNVSFMMKVNAVKAGLLTSTGSQFFGYEAGLVNTNDYSTGVGYQSLMSNTTGNQNTGVGFQSLTTNTTGGNNTGVGFLALTSNTTGGSNVAVGTYSLPLNTTGASNVAVGDNALFNATTATDNTSVGKSAMNTITTGSYNTAVGSAANVSSSSVHHSIALGYNASAGNNQFAISPSITSIKATGISTGAGYVLTDVSGNGVLTLVAPTGGGGGVTQAALDDTAAAIRNALGTVVIPLDSTLRKVWNGTDTLLAADTAIGVPHTLATNYRLYKIADSLGALISEAGGGTVTSVSGTTNRITVATGTTTPVIDISSSYMGQASITTLGTIGTGTWQGTSIGTTYTDAKIKTVTGTSNRLTIGGTSTDPTFDISTSYVGQATITTLGTIVTGTWNGTAIANANLANSTISGISLGSNLANLTATDATLTFSGTYTGATARTIGLNLSNANTWAATQSFTSPSIATSITTASSTIALFNATPTTINAFGAATTLNIGASSATWNIGSNSTINGGAAANDDMTIQGTSNATRTTSFINIQPNGGGVNVGGTDNRGVLTVQQISAQTFATNTDLTDAGRFFVMENTSTANAANLYTTITLQLNPTGSLGGGRAIGDIRLIRETINNSNSYFLFSGFRNDVSYKDYAKIAYDANYLVGKSYFGGAASASALIHLAAGTSTASTAPLKFTSGTNLTTAEAGAFEYDGTSLYFTPTGTTRQTIPYLGLAQTWSANQTFSGNIISSGSTSVIRLKGYTVATLPAGTIGDICYVSDALAPAFLATVVGGGSIVTQVLYNGSAWVAQ